jgi:hypothetical protein
MSAKELPAHPEFSLELDATDEDLDECVKIPPESSTA